MRGADVEGEYPLPHPDFTPEQLTAIYAEAKKNYTVEHLIREIEADEPTYPMEEVWEELLANVEVWKMRKARAS